MAQKPNILLIHSDQHRYDCLGVNGHPQLRTPHLDGLAHEGMNFAHAFTPIPVCAPSRNCLLTGRWPVHHGVIANFDTEAPALDTSVMPTFATCLRGAGYVLGHVGKWQVHPRKTPLDYGFHDYIDGRGYGAWRAEQGLPPHPGWANGWLGLADDGVAPEQSDLGWSASRTIDLLEQYAQSERPFFLRWDPREPHLPNVVPEPFASMYAPESLTPWPGFADTLEGKPFIQRQQRATWGVAGWTWDQFAPLVSRYLGEVSLMDAQIGRVLAALDELTLQENTLVVYTTDHGDMCASHGMVDKHYVMYDDVTRVPLLVRWPGRVAAASVCGQFVRHALDLAATFCEAAGTSVPDTFQGQSLVPLLEGREQDGRTDAFSVYHGNQMGLFTQRMVRDMSWKYVWNATACDELYHLDSDPGELRNLASSSSHRDDLARLRRRMVEWMEAIDDPILNFWTRRQLVDGWKA